MLSKEKAKEVVSATIINILSICNVTDDILVNNATKNIIEAIYNTNEVKQ